MALKETSVQVYHAYAPDTILYTYQQLDYLVFGLYGRQMVVHYRLLTGDYDTVKNNVNVLILYVALQYCACQTCKIYM